MAICCMSPYKPVHSSVKGLIEEEYIPGLGRGFFQEEAAAILKKNEAAIKTIESCVSLYSGTGLRNFLSRVWQAVLGIFGKGCWHASVKALESQKKSQMKEKKKEITANDHSKVRASTLFFLNMWIIANRYRAGVDL